MAQEKFTHKTTISPKSYIEDYIKYYGRHRSTVVNNLLKEWEQKSIAQKAVIGSRILMEFGASIEELFAYTYAIYKQCNVAHDVPPDKSEVFFKHFFEYKHKKLFKFVRDNDFNNWIESHFNLLESAEMAKRMGYTKQYYEKSLSEAERCLEWKKEDFFDRDFRTIYNKLKHPFLVLAPIEQNESEKIILPIITESKEEDLVAKIIPVDVGLSNLEIFQSDIQKISQTIEFLLKLLLKRP